MTGYLPFLPQLGEPSYYASSSNSPSASPNPNNYSSAYTSRYGYQGSPQLGSQSQSYPAASQITQSYFPPSATYLTTPTLAQSSHGAYTYDTECTNIDDIAYRYSAEFDRAPGTPTVGIYAQDGLWDEEDEQPHVDTKPAQVGTAPSSRKTSGVAPTPKGRTRSGTVASAHMEEKTKSHHWGWTKKNTTTNSPTMIVEEQRQPEKGLKKQKSKGLLRGKGRRGELMVNVASDADESFEAPPPPMPSTPASFLTQSSPASNSGPFLSPINYPSPIFDSPLQIQEQTVPAKPAKTTSSWKRGVQKIFKSKSSAALREAAVKESTPPPLPNLPGPSTHPLGKPFTSSTPPMVESRRFHDNSVLSTPPSATSESFVLPSHPSLPMDPFASSLDLSSNNPTPPPTSPLARPTLRYNSPSLRDLKIFIPHKPTLSKARSLAQIHPGSQSAPAEKTDFFQHSKLAKRMSSVFSLSSHIKDLPAPPPNEAIIDPASLEPSADSLEPPSAPMALTPPVESPPLLPPHPPYFAAVAKRSPSIPSIITDVSTESDPITPPPTAPLPPVPSSPSTSNLQAPIHRSASNAVLLPRSRSTSMSLKAPPTSSSFFDLYEQLGIWPSAEKEKEQKTKLEQDKENMRPVAEIEATGIATDQSLSPVSGLAPIPTSTSLTSNISWDAALNAFPEAPALGKMDFGGPEVGDDEVIEAIADQSMVATAGDRSDVLSMVAMTSTSRSASQPTALSVSTSTNGDGASTSSQPMRMRSSRSSGRGQAGGSGNSSREGSPERRRSKANDVDAVITDDDSSDEDDVPLSKLHPEAAAAQIERRQARRIARAAKRMQREGSGEKRAPAAVPGRNPGGQHGWNGEGGVPADILTRKLERVLLIRAQREASALSGQQDTYRASLASREFARRPTLVSHNSAEEAHCAGLSQEGVRRAQSQGRVGQPSSSAWRAHPPLPPIITRPHGAPGADMGTHPGAISPTNMSFGRLPSANRVDPAFATAMQGMSIERSSSSHSHDMSREDSVATTATTSSQGYVTASSQGYSNSRTPAAPHSTRAPSRQEGNDRDRSAAVTRSNTTATTATQRSGISNSTKQRSRALSNAAPSSSKHEEAAMHSRAVTEPLPKPVRSATLAPAVIGALDGKKVALELHANTTARDVLVATYHRGDLQDAAVGMSWVLYEMFAELGCERQVREYEQLLPIYKGWDRTAKFNCFMFKQTNRGAPTWARTVPSNPPFLGSWVQYETRRGKWSKRWLETRGGHVFLARNDKGKDEIQINTLFFDVYTMTRPYDSPKPKVFGMKRIEAAATFEDANDYLHLFSAEEALTFKLLSAIYDAKSYTLTATYPGLIGQPGTPTTATATAHPHGASGASGTHGAGGGGRNPTLTPHNSFAHHRHPQQQQQQQRDPLVNLNQQEEKSAAFTGKGLLKI